MSIGQQGPQYKDLLTSNSAQWRSLSLRVRESAPFKDSYETPIESDLLISILLNQTFPINHFANGRWEKIDYVKGMGLITPSGERARKQKDLTGDSALKVIHILVPAVTIECVASELNSQGIHTKGALDLKIVDDPAISSVGASLLRAVQSGAPDLYAQATAQWLAAHLLVGRSKVSEWHRSLERERVSDYRLARVLEYIRSNLSERLDLRVLSREAGISPFHFAALFSKAVGATPHRHVQHLRMEAAKSMLLGSEKSILEVALTSGFRSAAHFGAMFRKEVGQSPTEYRTAHQKLMLNAYGREVQA